LRRQLKAPSKLRQGVTMNTGCLFYLERTALTSPSPRSSSTMD